MEKIGKQLKLFAKVFTIISSLFTFVAFTISAYAFLNGFPDIEKGTKAIILVVAMLMFVLNILVLYYLYLVSCGYGVFVETCENVNIKLGFYKEDNNEDINDDKDEQGQDSRVLDEEDVHSKTMLIGLIIISALIIGLIIFTILMFIK